MTEILMRVMNVINRVRNMQDLNMFAYAVFAVILVFGIMNCVLGYRLLRFWVMLFGFCIGAIGGALCMYYVDVADKMYYLIAMVVGGLVLGIIAFLSYRLGIFILGAGAGLLLSLYILHPTTSFVFFVCLLIGIGLGVLGLKFCREVLIVVTSLAGGVLTGVSVTKLLGIAEFPYGILISAAAAGLGLLIQFAMNRPIEDEEDEEEIEERRREARRRQKEEDYFDELAYEEMQREEEELRQMKRKKVPHVDLKTEEAATEEPQKVSRRRTQSPVNVVGEEAATVEPQKASRRRTQSSADIVGEEAISSENQKNLKRRNSTQVDFTVGEPTVIVPEKNISSKKKTLQVEMAEKNMPVEETKVARKKATAQTEATAQMEVTAEEAAWLEERRQLKQRQAVVEAVKAEAGAASEHVEGVGNGSRRARSSKRADAVVDVKVGK